MYNYEEDGVAEHNHLRKRYGKTDSDSPALLDIITALSSESFLARNTTATLGIRYTNSPGSIHRYRISLAYFSHSSCVTPHLFMFSSLAHQKDG
jgi:hypothetical protein